MASVVTSATQSTASLFGVIEDLANATSRAVGAGAIALDTLNIRAHNMHKAVRTNAVAQSPLIRMREATAAATEYTNIMEDSHRKNFPGEDFDRKAFFSEALKQVLAAIDKDDPSGAPKEEPKTAATKKKTTAK